MPRQPRENQEGVIFYHIMVQGINREYIFQNEVMISKYLELMTKYSEELEVMVIAYCIMNNHAHILVRSEDVPKLSKMMQKINTIYARFYNYIKGRVGYVFRDRYLSQPILSDEQLINCVRYIHDNPVKAKMVSKPSEYKYSNYTEFYEKDNVKLLQRVTGINFSEIENILEYSEGDFIELEIDNKTRIMDCISRYCNRNKVQIKDIFSEINILKQMVKYLKKHNQIRYSEIMEVMEIPQNVMLKLQGEK